MLLHAVRTGHPMYFNQLWAECDPMAVSRQRACSLVPSMLSGTWVLGLVTVEAAFTFLSGFRVPRNRCWASGLPRR